VANVRILGIDPGLRLTGFGMIEKVVKKSPILLVARLKPPAAKRIK
jgi:Holliday junction resolvasome RuvABC endonuclease subunit